MTIKPMKTEKEKRFKKKKMKKQNNFNHQYTFLRETDTYCAYFRKESVLMGDINVPLLPYTVRSSGKTTRSDTSWRLSRQRWKLRAAEL